MISLGSLSLKNPLVLAPLAGYTDLPFREICSLHGASLVYTELLSAEAITRRHPKTLQMMKISDKERPVIIQIFGKDVSTMADAAKIAEELSPDGIDINMGCCMKKVCAPGAGAGLLRNTLLLSKITEAVVKSVKIPVSAKIRIGYTEKEKNYLEVLHILEECGVNHVAVHGRTASQQYTGLSNWDIIAEIASFSKIPVIGSGDIKSNQDAYDKINFSKCTAVMIGRGAIGNPWIFSGKIPEDSERGAEGKLHLLSMIDHYGDYGLVLARKHLLKYFNGVRGAANLRGKIANTTSLDYLIGIIDEFTQK